MSWRDAFLDYAATCPPELAQAGLELAETIARLFPEMTASARPGWRAVTFRHPRAGYVCGVFVLRAGIALIFEHDCEMSDPDGLLEGRSRQVRHIPVLFGRQIAEDVLTHYIAEAISLRS